MRAFAPSLAFFSVLALWTPAAAQDLVRSDPDRAEAVLGVAGEAGQDPTEPPRSRPYPHRAAPLADALEFIPARRSIRAGSFTPFSRLGFAFDLQSGLLKTSRPIVIC